MILSEAGVMALTLEEWKEDLRKNSCRQPILCSGNSTYFLCHKMSQGSLLSLVMCMQSD